MNKIYEKNQRILSASIGIYSLLLWDIWCLRTILYVKMLLLFNPDTLSLTFDEVFVDFIC